MGTKQIIGVLSLLVFFSSCAESFKQLPPEKFNDTVASRKDIKSVDELVVAYFNYRNKYKEHEVQPRLSIISRKLDSGNYEITAIDTVMDDDALAAEKIIMIAAQHAQTWKALDIKYNWKCRDGHGNTDWGTGE
jgi:hypothetical protein